jgi:hypothetical protein
MNFLLIGTITMLAPNPAPLVQLAVGVIGMERIQEQVFLPQDDLGLVQAAGYDGFRVTKKSDKEVTVTVCKMSDCESFDVGVDGQGKINKIERSNYYETHKEVMKATAKSYYERNREKVKKKALERYYKIKNTPSDKRGTRGPYLPKFLRKQINEILERVEFDLPYLKPGIGRKQKKVIRPPEELLEFEPAANQETPAQEAETNELYKIVWDTILKMTDVQQEVARLILDEVKDNNIAQVLDLSLEEVKRVREFLKDSLK